MKKANLFLRNLFPLVLLLIAVASCDFLKGGDSLYFCEKYIPATDDCEGKSTKYTTGTLTVMVKLSKPIGETDVNINITDLSSGKVVETIPFTVTADMDYIYFDNVAFEQPGKYKVSLLKKDNTVVVSNEIEII
ncbi:MAG: hypothetical protein WBP57_03090 [Ignavibacteria bacterium]|jgi:hypothetical protein|nr:MAG: hypothetical protein EDM69_00040 [Chlorobiota bacterium]KXK03670.1 MAG: hypothetical protein UZ04_CHB001001309 [Chlorobi bacterium OLB4]MBV6398936.1 hypothetical protein [Ignavibacteria bacterium]MCC6886225.1 hypothetical protein [Ignavibacteriales bacterium]MCE7952321.1 hypothetical protein [Chlorobi bacterium CHB7]OQY77068.1 MAG: hypothetical protein B6D43_08130 [Ignavibacteriales bacterium UTCHB1]RIK48578.1 MAG: hypothetical protein DCC60_07185 [Ignavibacteriota bacterium]